MPVVGRRDDHGIDVAVVEQGAEVAVWAGRSAHGRDRLLATAAVYLGDGRHRRIRLVAEVQYVPLADQPEADEAQPDAVVGPDHSPIRPRRQRRGGSGPQDRPPAQPGGPLVGWVHRGFLAGTTGVGQGHDRHLTGAVIAGQSLAPGRRPRYAWS